MNINKFILWKMNVRVQEGHGQYNVKGRKNTIKNNKRITLFCIIEVNSV